jgi:hypothetical protein
MHKETGRNQREREREREREMERAYGGYVFFLTSTIRRTREFLIPCWVTFHG